MHRLLLLAALCVTVALGATNTCRDTAVCCQVFDFQAPSGWDAQPYGDVMTVPVDQGGAGPWAAQGIQVSLDEIFSLSGEPYPVGLYNASKSAPTVTGANRLGVWPAEGLTLAAFEYFPTTLLRRTSTIRWRISRQPACIASVRTLRSVDFDHRQSVDVTTFRVDPISGDEVQVENKKTVWAVTDTKMDDAFEFTSLHVDEARIRFYGQGYGAVTQVEVCYHAPVGVDQCGVCGGPGTGCAVPGDACVTGLGGACNSGTLTTNLTCVSNLINSPELCNGIDDNCNGEVDEGPWPVVECGVGACHRNYSTCINGEPNSRCVAGTPTAELCNGIDDNCNGQVDEGGVCDSPSSTAAPTPPPTHTPSTTSTASVSTSTTPSASQTPTPSQTRSPSAPATPPPTPSSTPAPRPGSDTLIPLGTCVRQTDDPATWQAVFGYVYTGNDDITLEPADGTNWLRSAYTLNQPQPTTFRSNQMFSRAFDILFAHDAEVQWTLALPNRTRQTALLNRHSHRCDTDLFGGEPIQPHLWECIHRSGGRCTAHLGYTNPNPQTIELDVGPRNAFDPTPLDRRQPRVFWPGFVADAMTLEFDCTTPDWRMNWTVTGASAIFDQASLC